MEYEKKLTTPVEEHESKHTTRLSDKGGTERKKNKKTEDAPQKK